MIVKKMMVILNPSAGRGRGIKTLPKIEKWSREIYSQKGIMSRIELTVPDPFSEKHATNLAQRAVKENYDLVFAAGGDGTANEVANGLKTGNDLFGRNTAMATGRIGSGSDLAEALGIPWDIWKALNLAASGNTMLMDLGNINGRFFVNECGTGFNSAVAITANQIKKSNYFLPPKFVYLLALLRELSFGLNYPLVKVQMFSGSGEKTIEERITLVEIANGFRCGGVFRLAPHAILNDGLLDICMVGELGRLDILRFIPKAMKGTHFSLKQILKDNQMFPRASEIVITSLENKIIPCHADGEILPAEKEYRIRIFPKALQVAVPWVKERAKERRKKSI